MERDGIVSVWAGIFETDIALMEYANEMNISFDSEGTETVSAFSRDFFDGTDAWPFDTDFWERSLHEFTDDPEVLVLPFSEGTAIGPALKRHFPHGLEKTYNAAILVYNYEYDYDEYVRNPSAPVTFLAAVPYDGD